MASSGRFLESVRYLHLIPQLLRHPDAFHGQSAPDDSYGRNFLETVAKTPDKTQRSRLSKIAQASATLCRSSGGANDLVLGPDRKPPPQAYPNLPKCPDFPASPDNPSGVAIRRPTESMVSHWRVACNCIGMTKTLVLLAAGLSVLRADQKVSFDLDLNSDQPERMIVRYKTRAPSRTADEGRQEKVRRLGGKWNRNLDLIDGAVFEAAPSSLRDLANDPDVEFIAPDRPVRPSMDYTRAAVGAGAAASYGLTGTGIAVAVIDSGISDHWDLKNTAATASRIVYSQDFTGSGSTRDELGHGTHVAGVIAGNAYYSTGAPSGHVIKGIAPNVNLVNLKVLDKNGVGYDSYVIAAIDRAVALKATYNIRVINLSLGRGVFGGYATDPLCQAVERAWTAGIVVVVAAGNHGRLNNSGVGGYGTINAPGNDPYVITVGAMKTMGTAPKSDDRMATYSSKGPSLYDQIAKPDLVAPGNLVVSTTVPGTYVYANNSYTYVYNTLWNNYPSDVQIPQAYLDPIANPYDRSGSYFRLNGTSMAAPVVSGAAVLLIQKTPSLTPDLVKARLMKTASKQFPASSQATDPTTGVTYTTYYDAFTVGAGYLDIAAALQNNDTGTGRARSPKAVRSSTGQIKLTFGTNIIWGTNLTWGTNIIWGTTNLSSTNIVWGTGSVWSASLTGGTNIIWGTANSATLNPGNIVWGTNTNVMQPLNILAKGE